MIRVLVTGFGPFPGNPSNPTEALMRRLSADPPVLGPDVGLTIEVIATEYASLRPTLDRLGHEVRPDIAVHFGLAGSATGLRLERRARNAIAAGRPDAAGFCPTEPHFVSGGNDLASSLPFPAIERALTAAGVPFEASHDCGDYLCNAIFYHAVGALVPGYAPAMAGFVHVPPTEVMAPDILERGARAILAATVDAFAAQRRTRAPLTVS